jgi:hypothetical protein
MKCGPIYKKTSQLCVGKKDEYEGLMSGYEIRFETEKGEFMTRSIDYGLRGIDVPVIVTLTEEGVAVRVKQ